MTQEDSPRRLPEQASPLTSVQRLREQSRTARRWCPRLETAVDHANLPSDVPCPEQVRIGFSSQAGRRWLQQHSYVPIEVRRCIEPVVEPVEVLPPLWEKEEQLIYLAVYRDKVAQQQAAALANEGSSSSSAGKRERRIYGQEDCGPRSQSVQVRAAPQLSQAGPVSARSSGSSKSKQTTSRSSATHYASVGNKAPGCGTTAEHFEDKRLGKLFDEWLENPSALPVKAAQMSEELLSLMGGKQKEGSYFERKDSEDGHSSCRRARGARLASYQPVVQTLKQERTNEGALSGTAPTAPRTRTNKEAEHQSQLGDCQRDNEASTSECKEKDAQKARMERLWSVISNPKARQQSLSESGALHYTHRGVPTHIEGFKPLMLSELYKGPWRLDAA